MAMMSFPRHALLEETRAITFLFALHRNAVESRRVCHANDASRVEVIDGLRVVDGAAGRRPTAVVHECDASLDAGPFTISIFLRRILTRRQCLDAGHDNIAHDFILTAERGGRECRCHLLLIVQWLFAAPIQDVTIRFCSTMMQRAGEEKSRE